ncbi:hypothetical protein [Streptomyces sp. NPDC005209]|uniref:hypothetical protein n=1 Tax=Streptomyces sp. NPDC005209 TaxID=3156715 RepID=UPI0033B42EFA
MDHGSAMLRVAVASHRGADISILARWTEQLGQEFKGIGVIAARPIDADLSTDAKSGGAALTELLITLASSSVLVAVVQSVQAFVTRANGSTVHLEIDGDVIDLQGVEEEERQRLVEAWLLRQNSRFGTPSGLTGTSLPPVQDSGGNALGGTAR